MGRYFLFFGVVSSSLWATTTFHKCDKYQSWIERHFRKQALCCEKITSDTADLSDFFILAEHKTAPRVWKFAHLRYNKDNERYSTAQRSISMANNAYNACKQAPPSPGHRYFASAFSSSQGFFKIEPKLGEETRTIIAPNYDESAKFISGSNIFWGYDCRCQPSE